MPPRPAPTYTPYLTSLIQSTTYDSLPSVEELESLNSILQAQSAAVNADIEKRQRRIQKKKEKERDDGEAAALEANAAAGLKLEAIERARTEAQARKGSPGGVKVKKERTSLSPAPSNASSASFRPQHGIPIQPITYGQSQMKKRKKRVVDSDDEGRPQARDRSTTLASPPPHQAGTSGLKLKLSGPQHLKSRPTDPSPTPSGSTGAVSVVAGASIDFSLPPPPSRPLIPLRPGVQSPLKPGPKRQSEVDEDFSNVKVPSQTAFTTFWNSVEPYLREIREDDLAMLGFKADAPELYELPPRGRHYTEVWDEEDGLPPGTTPRISVPNLRQSLESSRGALPVPHFVPAAEMRDEALVDEHRGLGSLTERIIAAVVGDKDTAQAKKEEVAGKGNETEGSRDGMRVDVVDLEDRMKRELRSVMLLGEHEDFDPENRHDDEVTSALRQCQRLLLQQTQINDARKARLAEVARQRLAFAEYQNALEGIEKSVEAGWTRRVKKYGITPKKVAGTNQPAPGRPPVQENLKRLVQVRKGWIDNVGRIMREQPKGLVSGLPERSIYEGIGEETEERDEKLVEDSMEVESGDEAEEG